MANQKPRLDMNADSNSITKREFITSASLLLATIGLLTFGIISLFAGISFLVNSLIRVAIIAILLFLAQVLLPRNIRLRWIARTVIVVGVIVIPSFVIAIQTALFVDDLAPEIRRTFGELTEIRVTSIAFDRASVSGIGSCCCKLETGKGRARYQLKLHRENQGWGLDSWDAEWSECGSAGSL